MQTSQPRHTLLFGLRTETLAPVASCAILRPKKQRIGATHHHPSWCYLQWSSCGVPHGGERLELIRVSFLFVDGNPDGFHSWRDVVKTHGHSPFLCQLRQHVHLRARSPRSVDARRLAAVGSNVVGSVIALLGNDCWWLPWAAVDRLWINLSFSRLTPRLFNWC